MKYKRKVYGILMILIGSALLGGLISDYAAGKFAGFIVGLLAAIFIVAGIINLEKK